MSITEPNIGEAFNVRIQHYHATNPSQKWSNNYILLTRAATVIDAIERAVGRIVSFHSEVSLPGVIIERAVVSTRIPDTNPYDANEFTSFDYNLAGIRTGSPGDPLPLEACTYLRKTVPTGRVGKIFLRGTLTEGDVAFGQSLFRFNDPATYEASIQAAIVETQVDTLFLDGGDPFLLAMPTGKNDFTPTRAVTGIASVGVRFVNMNKRYYDRA